ncbi:MAG TPA: hypothetical protein VE988_05975 [Gemmataceae bacterium]|nr:hypothetical protein [Gemmataceae bacterium]
MIWTVLYAPRAEQELTKSWLAADDRLAMTKSAHAIDRLLANDPENSGQVRFDTVRLLVIPPLGVEYEVFGQDRLVWVLHVWDCTKAPPP